MAESFTLSIRRGRYKTRITRFSSGAALTAKRYLLRPLSRSSKNFGSQKKTTTKIIKRTYTLLTKMFYIHPETEQYRILGRGDGEK